MLPCPTGCFALHAGRPAAMERSLIVRQSLQQLAIQYSTWAAVQSVKEAVALAQEEQAEQDALRRQGANVKR
ncbi:cysteine synthase [Paenibacillus popilliae ATCC 14706]|uniref:Cysteine synthase n=1 Tax=Paenibacillus popilliae ATCC 14706 TaxID=1212764 RepID=M9L7K2_PAEPP|nr:cysteine synthase [Paenibacillus popilliae ATCC 14706]